MKTDRQTIRTLLVDDHALFRESVARVLATEPDLEIQHCGTIRDALALLAQNNFDLVLLDHDLGNERASSFLPAARQAGFTGRVLIVTAWVSDTEARRLMRQGVSGIFRKEAPLEELTASIRTIAAGGAWTRSFVVPNHQTRGGGNLHPADVQRAPAQGAAFRSGGVVQQGDRLAPANF